MKTIPDKEPSSATAGDTVQWSRSLSDYPASAGWSLKYVMRGANGSLDMVAVASGDDYLVTAVVPAAGDYALQGYVVKGTEKHTICVLSFMSTPDLSAAVAGYDSRSHARRVLDAIERVIEGRATRGDQETTVDGTRLVKMTVPELLALRSRYQAEYRREQEAARLAQGRNSGRKIVTRFTR